MQIEEKYPDYKIEENKFSLQMNDDFDTKLRKSINSIIRSEGYITYSIENKDLSTKGGNYLGVLYEINVKGQTSEGEKETNIFVKKRIPADNNVLVCLDEVYSKELFFYNELSKVFEELQDEAQIPVDERYRSVKSFNESNTEAILLENVAKKGYRTPFRMDVVSFKFAELSIKELAKFHAISFAIEKRRPNFFLEKVKKCKTPFTSDESEWETLSSKVYEYIDACLEDDYKENVQKILQTPKEKIFHYLEDQTTTCCLCHGDFRANNILMKEIDNEIVDVIPVDYQLMYYGCPVNDFIYFIYGATDKEFRQQHLETLKNMYYETFKKFMNRFDLDANKIFPREEFDKIFKERIMYGFIMALILCPFLFAPEEDALDVSKDCLYSFSLSYDSRMEKRLKGLLEEFQELGYL